MAFYSVRSDRLFCERLEYDLLFRWFFDMDVEEPGFDASTSSKNRGRLMEHEVAGKFFAEVVTLARSARLLDDKHFTVDGTLIEAWASAKSFRPKADQDRAPGGDFHGQQRCNDTHQSTTDGHSRLARKSPGKEARLSFGAHALMDSRRGLCARLKCGAGHRKRITGGGLLARASTPTPSQAIGPGGGSWLPLSRSG